MGLDGFSMRHLITELNASLAGGRIDKIHQPTRQMVQFSIRQPGKNHFLCLSIQPQNPILYQPYTPLESPSEPSAFCMLLRKHLEGGRVAAITQTGLDRIVNIDIDCLGAGGRIVTRTCIAELMGKYSNLILMEDGRIVDALRRISAATSRIRLVLPGIAYESPPSQGKLNATTTAADTIIETLRQRTDKKLAAALSAICQGFGPVTAKEIAFSAGLSPDAPVASLDTADFSSLLSAVAETVTAPCAPCLIYNDAGQLQGMAAFPLHYLPNQTTETFATMNDMVIRARALIQDYVPPDKERFRKLLRNEQSRSLKKLEKLRQEAAVAETANEAKIIADNLLTYQYQLSDHADSEFTAPNIYDPEGKSITIPLNQQMTIQKNIQNYYHRYNKLKRAQSLLREQIEECEETLRYLSGIEASLLTSSSRAELDDIRAELILGGWLKEKPKAKPTNKSSQPFRFITPDGDEILVGKNNYQNDRLTFKTAQRDDIWLHTKDIPGSHVILRSTGAAPAPTALALAANLAAHFSQAASSSKVPVDYTRCRFVKKPSGARPGFVTFTNQKTLFVTPDEEQLALLRQQDKNAADIFSADK